MQEHACQNPTTKILRQPTVIERTGISATTIWRLERRGDFPPRVRLSPGAIGWRENDIENWIESRAAEARQAR